MTTTPSPSASATGSHVPYARRRSTPAQLDALHRAFEAAPHPTRAQRQALANEIGMELKSVTNWFQNRRQTTRRKSLSFNENNNPSKMRLPHSPSRHRHLRLKTPFDRSKISLDHIAALSERPSVTSQRPPLTPRKSNVQRKKPSSPSDLWTHMLSSPVIPPSSPDTEEARLAVLSSRAKILFPLDWACLKARQKKWVDEDADGLPTRPVSRCCGAAEEDGKGSDTINLQTGTTTHRNALSLSRNNSHLNQFDDVEAAMTLLGFKMSS